MPHRTIVARQLAELFSVLSHPIRVRIMIELRSGELCVNSLVNLLGIRQSAVSQQLALLKSHNLIKERRDGRRVLYRLAMPSMSAWLVDGVPLIVPDNEDSQLLQSAAARAFSYWSEPHDESLSEVENSHTSVLHT